MAGPLEQFAIKPIIPIEYQNVDLSFTNSATSMVLAALLASVFLILATRTRQLVPGRLQIMAETLYHIVANMVRDNVGNGGRPYFPFIFTLFMFLLFGNLLGMFPVFFTFTSHIAVTFAMAMFVFVVVTIIGIVKHKAKFLTLFFPHGAPLWTAVLIVPIELISYFSRPVSLAVRLFANMMVGHVLLKVIAGFVIALGIAGVVPLALLIGISALEFLVAILQAYVFTILCCIYLHDALHLH